LYKALLTRNTTVRLDWAGDNASRILYVPQVGQFLATNH